MSGPLFGVLAFLTWGFASTVILRHVPLYLASSYATVIGGTLPTMWSVVDRRSQVVKTLIEALPPGVV